MSRRRAALLATVYVVGMGLTYAALGVTIALLGKTGSFGTQLAIPYVVVPICLLFAALAASMFGAFELQPAGEHAAKLGQVGGKGFGGAFAMGLVGGLIAAPCTGPFLLGLLTFVATTRDVARRRLAAVRVRDRHGRPVLGARRVRDGAAEERRWMER